MSEWYPIETAPRNGSIILIAREEYFTDAAFFCDFGDGFPWKFLDPCVEDSCINGQQDNETHGPTHWMPLPNPPEERRSTVSNKDYIERLEKALQDILNIDEHSREWLMSNSPKHAGCYYAKVIARDALGIDKSHWRKYDCR